MNISAADVIEQMYLRFTATLRFIDQVRGGIPKNPATIEGWIRSRIDDLHVVDTLAEKVKRGSEEERIALAERLIATTKTEMGLSDLSPDQLKEVSEAVWNGFKSDENGLYLEGRCIKAMIKESANIIKNIPAMGEFSALKARIAERFFVEETKVYLGLSQPHGTHEGFVHAMTPMGPISALKKVDYVEQATIVFTVRTLNTTFTNKEKNKMTPLEMLKVVLAHAAWNGLGAERSQGHGRFDVISILPAE
jgi:hypothetical protein